MTDDKKSLSEWADERAKAVHEENQEIARSNRLLRTQLRERDEDLEALRKRLGIYEALDAAVITPPTWLQPKVRTGKRNHAIPSLFLTDLHWGERVRPEEIGGVNAYDRNIAQLRVQRAASGAIKLCRDYLSGVEHDSLNLLLGGDLLSGEIHDELRETNVETLTESILGVVDVVVPAIRLLADHFKRLYIVAVTGNHGRTTKKPRAKRRGLDSFDGLVYHLLANQFSGDKRVHWQIAAGPDAHYTIYHTHYCLTHGDQFKGGSGISGALSPLLLGVHRKRRRDQQVGSAWDVLVCGHFHTRYFLRDLIVGGSVIGYNEYAHSKNLPFEEPEAALWLTTPERGVTTYMPVYLCDRQGEGW